MFFDFSFKKILPLLMVLLTLAGGSAAFALAYPDVTITYLTSLSEYYTDRSKATTYYWWSYKLADGRGGLGELKDKALRSGPALVMYKLLGKPPPPEDAFAAEKGGALSVPVLLYHGESQESYNIPLSRFVEQMRALKDNGWQTISMKELEDFLKNGKSLPEKSFLLTFDDGRKDSYYPTDPVLADLGFTATMFVVTGFSLPDTQEKKSTFYLSKTELKEMLETGRWELHSHGKEDHYFYTIDSAGTEGHFLSSKLWLPDERRLENEVEFTERITFDLSKSKETLEEQFDRSVIGFAYPFSDYGSESVNFADAERIVKDVVSSLYSLAFYQVVSPLGGTFEDTFNYPEKERFMIKRIEPSPSWSGNDLLETLEAGRAKSLPYTSTSFKGRDWIGTWGAVDNGEALTLRAEEDGSGAAGFLNGSGWWANYTFTATINWKSGSNVMVAGRYYDSKNYYFCAFSKDRVALRENNHGEVITLKNVSHNVAIPSTSAKLGISVYNNEVGCFIGDQKVVGGQITSLRRGGAALQVWDKTHGLAEAEVTEIEITPIN